MKNFSLKTREIKKKNKKKSGSNDENLRKLEPQQKQTVLIKKMSVFGLIFSTHYFLGVIFFYQANIWSQTIFTAQIFWDPKFF